MNRKPLLESESSGALMRHEVARSAPSMEGAEAPPNIFAGLWRHRWAMLAITIVFVIGAVVYLRVVPPSFTVTSKLNIEAPRSIPGLSAMSPSDAGGDQFLWTQVSIMQSPAVCGEAAKMLAPNATDEELHQLTNSLRGNVSPDVGKKDSLISLSYTDKTPEDAANNVNAITQAYIKYATKTHSDNSRALYDVLRTEENKYEEQLHRERDAEVDFKKLHPELEYTSTPGGGNVVGAEIASLYSNKTAGIVSLAYATAALNAAMAVKDDLSKVLQQAESEKYAGSPSTAAEIANVSRTLSDAEARLALEKGQLGSGNPFVVRDTALATEMRAKLVVLEQRYAQEYLAYLAAQKLHVEEQVKAIEAQIKQTENESQAVYSVAGDYAKLENEVAATQKLIDALATQVNQLGVVIPVSEIPNISVVETGRAEDASRAPEPSRVLMLTLAVGLACGAAFSLVREKLDQRVRTAEEIAGLLGLPVIGVVPHMKRGLTELARAQAVHWDPMSEVSEAYRAVRTAVHFGVPNGQARTIVVTSPTPSDGKSTLASNLAISMAQAGKRTLLLDADFRRPVQHKMFEMKDESGLTAVLAGHEPLSKAIRRTVVEGLDLLPAGPLPLNPSELLNGESFASILEELSQKYDHIILDCPPVIAVTDARILGAVCDISLLVLRAGKTTRRGAELARAGLLSVGSRLLGVVVNDVPRGEEMYGYYGSYAYQSGGGGRARIADENGGSVNGHSSGRRRRLPSPSGIDSM